MPKSCSNIKGVDFNSTNFKALFKKYPEENNILSNGLAGAYEGGDLQDCFDMCSKDGNCNSVSYYQLTDGNGDCNVYYENSTIGDLSSKKGWITYDNVINTCFRPEITYNPPKDDK